MRPCSTWRRLRLDVGARRLLGVSAAGAHATEERRGAGTTRLRLRQQLQGEVRVQVLQPLRGALPSAESERRERPSQILGRAATCYSVQTEALGRGGLLQRP